MLCSLTYLTGKCLQYCGGNNIDTGLYGTLTVFMCSQITDVSIDHKNK